VFETPGGRALVQARQGGADAQAFLLRSEVEEIGGPRLALGEGLYERLVDEAKKPARLETTDRLTLPLDDLPV